MNTGWFFHTDTHTYTYVHLVRGGGKRMSERIMGNSEHQKRKKQQTQIWITIMSQQGENREPSLVVPSLQKFWLRMDVKAQGID